MREIVVWLCSAALIGCAGARPRAAVALRPAGLGQRRGRALAAGLRGNDDAAAAAALAYGVHAWRRGASAHRDPALFARLIELGASTRPEVRFGAVYALARHQTCDGAALLADRVGRDPDAGVRGWRRQRRPRPSPISSGWHGPASTTERPSIGSWPGSWCRVATRGVMVLAARAT